jgi:glycosyltransferase involved in cell wall biosynthesis
MLPRLLYVGDVPVEASHHGSALLHRLLSDYPAEKLTILETATESQPKRRLSAVHYLALPIGNARWLNTRFHPYAVAWFSYTGKRFARDISNSVNGFDFESVLTVAHGFGWLAAAEIADRRKLPLHLIVHDDWPRVADVAPKFRSWLDERFGSVYRQAHSRLCVSPAMRHFYEGLYGERATVIFPSRSADCPSFESPPARLARNEKPFTIAFAGTINSKGYVEALTALQKALAHVSGRLLIFGPLSQDEAERLGLNNANTEIGGLIDSTELLTRLRNEADALFVPMSFAASDRSNMEMAFPSKLADCTAVGLPLLIYGPPYCSAAVWGRENAGVAEVVETETELHHAVVRLAGNAELRLALGKRALEVGEEYFSHARVQREFYEAVSVSSWLSAS